MLEQITTALIAGGVSVIGALVFWLCSRLRTKAMQNELNTIKQALSNSGKLYYVECPHCHNKIYLSQAKIEIAETAEIQSESQATDKDILSEFKMLLNDAINQFEEKKNNNGGIMEEEVKEEVHEESNAEKREIELIAQVRASYDVIGKALSELESMHADMPVAEEAPKEEPQREEVGPKDETESEKINDAEEEVKETETQEEVKEEKSEADDETKYYY